MTPVGVLSFALAAVAVVLVVPALVFFVQCVFSLFAPKPRVLSRPSGLSVVVLMPAHDESAGIGATIEALKSQLETNDRILIVADNCQDDTAAVARAAGAEVIERVDPERRGKGYALAFGFAHLESSPPDVVIVLDADCRLTPGSVDALTHDAFELGRPVQADNVSHSVDRSVLSMISSLAMLVRNRVRPRGFLFLGMPCQLMGTGMAFPWAVLQAAPDLEANLVEDLAMGAELAMLGHEPALCIHAGVRSELPKGSRAALAQRTRWEHGQLSTLGGYGPRLVRAGLAQGRLSLVAMGADLLVPPLAFLVGLLAATLGVSIVLLVLGGSVVPVAVSAAGLALVVLGVGAGWARYGRDLVPLRYMLLAPVYIVWKLPLYASFLFGRRERRWRRTER